jgi:hypothetical protein
MNHPSLWVVSPLYFDVPSYTVVREQVHEAIASQPDIPAMRVHFVVADDSGGLDTEAQALERESEVTVARPPFNLGHQRALVFALRSIVQRVSADDLIVTLDSDGEDRPKDVPRLLTRLLDGAAHQNTVVLALREQRRETLPFKTLYLAFRILFRVLTGTTIRSGNFAAFRGTTAQDVLSHPYFDLCYSSTWVALDLPITYVPCPRGERFMGQSKMNYGRLLMHGIRMLMPFTDRIAIRALIAFATAFALSLMAGVAVLAFSLLAQSSVSEWAIGGIVALMGFSLLSLANAVVLFAVFSQSSGISLSNIERTVDGSAGRPPSATD